MPYYRCPACGLSSYSAAGHSAARACPTCAAPLPEAAKVYPQPREEGVARVLAARPEAIAEARHSLADVGFSQAMRDTLTLLVSELVTNSVRHGGLEARDAVNLQITSDGAHVRVSVHDGGQGFDLAALEGDGGPLEVGGQGLVIVAALSDTWGVERSDDGCTVWCELALEEESVAAAEREITTGYVRELAFELARSNGAVSA